MLWSVIVTLSAFCYGISQANTQLPQGFRLCRRKEPDLDKCFVEAANEDYNLVKDGFAPWGLPSLQKLPAPHLEMAVGNQAVGVSFKIDLNDCYLTYTLDKFTSAHLDFDKRTLDFDAIFKNLTWHGQHNSTGRFLVGNFKGAGKFEATMYNALARTHSKFSYKVQDGKTYWNIEELQMKVFPKRMVGNAENIVANKQVNDAINKVLSDNWEAVFAPHFPDIEKAAAPVLQEVLNEVFRRLPQEELFPED